MQQVAEELKFKCWSFGAKSFVWPTLSNGKGSKLETKGPGEGGGLEGKEEEEEKKEKKEEETRRGRRKRLRRMRRGNIQ